MRLDCLAGTSWEVLSDYPSEPSFEKRVCCGAVQMNADTIAIFGGFGKSAAQKDFWEFSMSTDPAKPRALVARKQEKHISELGVELYYRNAVMSYDQGLVCSFDGSTEVFRLRPHTDNNVEPSFVSIANFENLETVEDDPQR